MRIEKRVDRILKVNIQVADRRTDSYGDDLDEFESWFRDIVYEMVGDPALDAIAAGYDTTPEDVLLYLTIVGGLSDEREYYGGEPAGVNAYYTPGDNKIDLTIPEVVMEANDRMDVLQSLIHEFDHAVVEATQGLKMPKNAFLSGFEAYYAAATDPQEHTARKAQMMELLSLGYSDKEIITFMIDRWMEGEPPPEFLTPEWKTILVAIEHQYTELLRQAKQEYAEFV
jgi:hypothetical protein